MASEIIQGFQNSGSDDPLNQALEALKTPEQFTKTYDGTSQRFDGLTAPLIRALRLTIGELQSLRDEVEELRRRVGDE